MHNKNIKITVSLINHSFCSFDFQRMPGAFQQTTGGDFAGSSHEFKTSPSAFGSSNVGLSASGSTSNLQQQSGRRSGAESSEIVTEASNLHSSAFDYSSSLFTSPVAAAAGFYQSASGRSNSSALAQMTSGVGASVMSGSSSSGPSASCQIVATTMVDTRRGIQASAR
jgi:hypothetical protein